MKIMKRKIHLAIIGLTFLVMSSCATFAQGPRVQPGGVPTPSPVFDISSLSNYLSGVVTILVNDANSNLLSVVVSNQSAISNILIEVNSLSNSVVNITTNPPTVYYQRISPAVLWDVVNMNTNLQAQASNTNKYSINMGITNQYGQTNIYGVLSATNDVWFTGFTNNIRGSQFSFAVVASGADRRIFFPTNYTYFKTNGWLLAGSLYTMVLTNGSLWRISAQHHIDVETTWQVTGTWSGQ